MAESKHSARLSETEVGVATSVAKSQSSFGRVFLRIITLEEMEPFDDIELNWI